MVHEERIVALLCRVVWYVPYGAKVLITLTNEAYTKILMSKSLTNWLYFHGRSIKRERLVGKIFDKLVCQKFSPSNFCAIQYHWHMMFHQIPHFVICAWHLNLKEILASTKRDPFFISRGFINWKKVITFKAYKQPMSLRGHSGC